ncbi:MAG TPA: ArsA-related P-loop ATPase, partial [Solirubrobacteraceae bacterium]
MLRAGGRDSPPAIPQTLPGGLRRAQVRITPSTVSGLLDKRLIFVTGKGGVGKSTVAIALGLLGARAGRRTIVVELAAQDRVRMALTGDHDETFVEHEVAPGLFTISIDPQHAMDEYLRVKVGPLGHMLGSS